MRKKGDLSMNMIIVAAISLLVLAIIAYLIFGASDNVTKGTGCEGVGGDCQSGVCDDQYPIHNAALDKSCESQGKDICCMRIGKLSD